MEMLAIDFCVVDKSSTGRENILVVTDVFSKFVWAFDTKDQKAATVARILINEIFYKFGPPIRLHSDQGRNFESKLITEICKRFNIRKSRTTPYHPEGNGQCERFNRTLFGLLRQLSEEKGHKWHLHLGSITAIYNSTPHSQSGYSPYLLMFGRDPRLPLDLWEEEYEKKGKSMEEDWLENCFKIQKNSWELARENLLNNWTKKNKSRLGKAKSTDLKAGQKVLIKENYIQGRSKLQNKFKN